MGKGAFEGRTEQKLVATEEYNGLHTGRARNRSEVDALSIDRVIGELFGFSNPFAKSVNLVSRSDDK